MAIHWTAEAIRYWDCWDNDRVDALRSVTKSLALLNRSPEEIDELTPLEMAVIQHHRDAVERILQSDAPAGDLEAMLVYSNWTFEAIDELCYQRGLEPHFPVMASTVRKNNLARLRYLLDRGGDPKVSSYIKARGRRRAADGKVITLLDLALSEAEVACVEMLLEYGATLDGQAVSRAVQRQEGTVEMMRFVLEAGADVDSCALSGCTPLVWVSSAAFRRSAEERITLMTLLLEHGANPNAAYENGTTALMYRSAVGDTAALHLLLQHGADSQTRNAGGYSALDFARMCKRPEAVAAIELLESL